MHNKFENIYLKVVIKVLHIFRRENIKLYHAKLLFTKTYLTNTSFNSNTYTNTTICNETQHQYRKHLEQGKKKLIHVVSCEIKRLIYTRESTGLSDRIDTKFPALEVKRDKHIWTPLVRKR